jgi:hypothetical protein
MQIELLEDAITDAIMDRFALLGGIGDSVAYAEVVLRAAVLPCLLEAERVALALKPPINGQPQFTVPQTVVRDAARDYAIEKFTAAGLDEVNRRGEIFGDAIALGVTPTIERLAAGAAMRAPRIPTVWIELQAWEARARARAREREERSKTATPLPGLRHG